MLQRIITPPPLSPGRPTTWQRGLLSGTNSALLRYILIIAILCAVGCLYYLQMNRLSDLHSGIIALNVQAHTLEQRNVELARQWARWNTPSYIEAQADAAGYSAPTAVIRVDPGAAANSGPTP